MSGSALFFTCNSVIRYTCEGGYTLQGSGTVTCQASGSWTAFPTCSRDAVVVRCQDPGQVQNGRRTGQVPTGGYTVGSTVSFECNDCFEGGGDMTCLASGRWTRRPECDAVRCTDPGPVHNAARTVSSDQFGCTSTVTYRCNPGYELQGSGTLTCDSDGTWDDVRPICVRVSCPNPGQVENAVKMGNFHLIDSVVNYECNECYVGGGSIKCGNNRQWTPAKPTCQVVSCGDPGQIQNGDRFGANFQCGNTVTYSCRSGYRLEGSPTLTCESDRQWSDPLPTCTVLLTGCGNPGTVLNARRVGNNFGLNAVITYQCEGCYQGGGTARCQPNGRWTTLPTCTVRTCQSPGTILNGALNPAFGPFNCGSAVTYTCTTGYQIQGQSRVTCGINGQWSSPPPTCTATLVGCGDPGTVTNALRSGSNFAFGGSVTFRCNRCYTGGGTITCQQSGRWTARPECTSLQCPPPPTVVNGLIAGQAPYLCDATVRYSCNFGYQIQGLDSLTCGENGNWIGNAPLCSPIGVQAGSCPAPTQIQNGFYTGATFTVGSIVDFQCNPGFRLQGSASISCLAGGQWSGVQPTCVSSTGPQCFGEIFCPDLQFVSNAVRIPQFPPGGRFRCGEIVMYQCTPGFQIQGSPTLTCGSNGAWNANPPVCLQQFGQASLPLIDESKQNCEEPQEMPNAFILGQVKGGRTTYINDTVVYYVCNTTGEDSCSEGGGAMRCGKDPITEKMVWSPALTPCRVKSGEECRATFGQRNPGANSLARQQVGCQDPGEVVNGQRIDDAFRTETVVVFTCDPGYRLDGASALTCQSTGQWSATAPRCVDQSVPNCGDPGTVFNAQRSSVSSTSVGAVVTYTCNSGYRLEGDAQVRCQSNGLWSPRPICVVSNRPALICQSRQLDLVFVLDNSSYVGMEDWQTMVNFMIDILDRLPTGQQDVRIGMVTFADTAKSDVFLDGFTDRDSLINALRGARDINGDNNAAEGIRIMVDEQFTARNGDRPGVPNVGILVTSKGSAEAIQAADRAKAQGIQIFVVAVATNGAEIAEISQIASSSCADQNFFLTSDVNQLASRLTEPLARKACGMSAQPPTGFTCSSPGTPQNGRQTSALCGTYPIDSIVTYTCNPGYTMSGQAFQTCIGGQWSPPSPPLCIQTFGK